MEKATGTLIGVNTDVLQLKDQSIERTKLMIGSPNCECPLIVFIENELLTDNVFEIGKEITAYGRFVGLKQDEQGSYMKFTACRIEK